MIESEAALEIGKNIGEILVLAGVVPAFIAAPAIALFGYASFLFGKKYERKWDAKKRKSDSPVVVETVEQFEEQNDTSNTETF